MYLIITSQIVEIKKEIQSIKTWASTTICWNFGCPLLLFNEAAGIMLRTNSCDHTEWGGSSAGLDHPADSPRTPTFGAKPYMEYSVYLPGRRASMKVPSYADREGGEGVRGKDSRTLTFGEGCSTPDRPPGRTPGIDSPGRTPGTDSRISLPGCPGWTPGRGSGSHIRAQPGPDTLPSKRHFLTEFLTIIYYCLRRS